MCVYNILAMMLRVSALTVIVGIIFAKVTFVILFHLDNKKKYKGRFSGKLNLPLPKQIVKKMIFTDSIFDVINNVSRFLILLDLLRMDYQAAQAAITASIIASSLLYRAINLLVRRLHVFSSKKNIC
jgi:ammonia channel protein AmtB